MRVAFLGHNQLPGAMRPLGGYLSPEDADRLVHELAAERLTKKIIRAFAPDSTFQALRRERCRYIPVKLPPKEVANVRFSAPRPVATGVPRTLYLPRFHEIFGENQLRISL